MVREVQQMYLQALLAADAALAARVALDRGRGSQTYLKLCDEVITPAMHEIGALWQRAEITVAQEHVATAISQRVLAQAWEALQVPVDPIGRKLVAACPAGELHGLGLRMIADAAEMAGWTTFYIGPSVPLRDLVEFTEREEVDVVALSASLPVNFVSTRETIEALHGLPRRPRIVLGGTPFMADPRPALSLGADASAAGLDPFLEVLDDLAA